MPLSKLLVGFDFEQWQAERKARRERLKPEYCAEYGVKNLTDDELDKLEQARRLLKECDGCSKLYCYKPTQKFHHPLITVQDGRIKIETVLCDVWLEECYKERCQRSGIPMKYATRTFADYKVTADNERAVKLAQWFLSGERKKGLYFYGGAGTGKTFLASLVAREYALQSKSLVFGDVPLLLSELKRTFNDRTLSTEGLLDRYCQSKLLVLDDLGAEQITDWSVDILYQIINSRYNNEKPIIITSNLDFKDLAAKFGQVDEISGRELPVAFLKCVIRAFWEQKTGGVNHDEETFDGGAQGESSCQCYTCIATRVHRPAGQL